MGPRFYFICGSLFLSNGLAAYLGNENYEKINYYYTFRGMATYVNINPSLDSGKSFADAGEVPPPSRLRDKLWQRLRACDTVHKPRSLSVCGSSPSRARGCAWQASLP